MNRETAKQVVNVIEKGICEKKFAIAKHWDAIKAFANGAEIQLKADIGWIDVSEPQFDEDCEYRVKPEPTTRWRAEKGENYWTIDLSSFGAKPYEYTDVRDDFDERNFSFGNYFKTRELAEIGCEKFKEVFALFRDGIHESVICVKKNEKH